jgi:HK97 family phage portal protein
MPNFFDRLIARWRAPAHRKAFGAASLFALASQPDARWTPRNYAALARAGYQTNPVGYRAVRMIAENAASVPWLFYQDGAEVADHPLAALLARPNPLESGTGFFETLYGHLLVAGNAYVDAAILGDTVRALHLLRPDRVRIIAGPDGWPEAYEYSADGRVTRFAPEADRGFPVLHLKLFHPLDDHYGLSPLEAAAKALDIHNAGTNWNKALLDNAARPSGALVYAGPDSAPNLSEEQLDRLKSELESQYQGSLNAGRPLLLEGGLSWTAMSLSPQDMDFANARASAAREIALAFGVPPMLLGIPGDNTYANYREANLALWRQTIIPLIARTADALNLWLAPRFGAGLSIGFDLDAISALGVDRDALWARVGAASFLTEDEKRAAVGYGALEADPGTHG